EADGRGRRAGVVDEAAAGGAGVGVGVGGVVDRFDGEGVAGAVEERARTEGARPAAGAGGGDVVGAGAGEVAGGVGAVPAAVGAAVFWIETLTVPTPEPPVSAAVPVMLPVHPAAL